MPNKKDVEYVFNLMTYTQKRSAVQYLHDKANFSVNGFSNPVKAINHSSQFLQGICKNEKWMKNFLFAVARDISIEIKGNGEYTKEKALASLNKQNFAEIAAVIAYFNDITPDVKEKIEAMTQTRIITADRDITTDNDVEGKDECQDNSVNPDVETNELLTQLNDAVKCIDELRKKTSQLENDLNECKQNLKKKNKEIQDVRNKLLRLEQDNSRLSIEGTQRAEKLVLSNERIMQLETENAQLKEKNKEMATQACGLQNHLDEMEKKAILMQNGIDSIKKQHDVLNLEKINLEQKLVLQRREYQEIQQRYVELLETTQNRILIYSDSFNIPNDIHVTVKFARATDVIRWEEYDCVYAIKSKLSYLELKLLEKQIGTRLRIEKNHKAFIENYRREHL